MCRSDGLIGLSSTRTSASPGAKGGVGISASFNTLFGSPVSRKINAFINTSWVFRRRLIPAGCSKTSGTGSGAGDEGEHLRRSDLLHAFAERNLPLCHSLVLFLRGRHALPHLGKQLFTAAPNWKSRPLYILAAWMKLFAATRSKRKFNNPVSFDEKRSTCRTGGGEWYYKI